MTRNRRKSRELALQALYAYEMRNDENPLMILDLVAESNFSSHEVKEYARSLMYWVSGDREQIDAVLQRHAQNWELGRMAAIDRNVMRIAVAELLNSSDVPAKVAIDEAVELAKLYGTDESGKFVNGIIDAVYKELSSNAAGKE
jgi:N utilization substance protein B